MTNDSMLIATARGGLCLLVGLVCLAGTARGESPYDPGWTQNFRVGWMTALGIRGNLNLQGDFSVAGNNPGAPGVSGVDHFYDDGYVRVDDTGNAAGYTSYWGYDSAVQYNAASQQLLMHSSSSFSATGSASGENEFAVGIDLAYGGNLKRWERTRLGWEFGLGWLPFGIEDNSPLSASVYRNIYAFDVGDIILPAAPYNGGASGIGPTIHDVATEAGTDTLPATVLGSRSLDVNLYSFRLGPTLFYDVNPYVGVSLSLGPAVGLVSQTYNFNESITFSDGTSAGNNGSFSATDVIFGGYVNAVVTFHVEKGGDFYLGAQYMPMTGTTISSGGREASLEFGGQVYFSAGVSWSF